MIKPMPAGLLLALALPCGSWADPAADLTALRQEIDAMRSAYEARLQALEQRLKAAEAAVAAPPPATPAPAPAPPAPPAVANAFNPALSLILSGIATRTSQDPSNYAIGGFPLPAGSDAGPGTRGVNGTQLLWLAGLSALLLAAMVFGGVQRLGRFGLYGAFALAVTASVQRVGVYLVFSSLIIPALATRGRHGARRHALAYAIGALGDAAGLALSALFDLLSGAVIVWALAVCAFVFMLAGRAMSNRQAA